MRCILDTSAVFALLVPRDQHHDEARRFAREPALTLDTTSVILGEAFTSVRARSGYDPAMRWIRGARQSAFVTVHHLGSNEDAAAWAVIEEFAGVPLSYADATVIALGRRLGISRVFAFDDDFRQAGLTLVP